MRAVSKAFQRGERRRIVLTEGLSADPARVGKRLQGRLPVERQVILDALAGEVLAERQAV